MIPLVYATPPAAGGTAGSSNDQLVVLLIGFDVAVLVGGVLSVVAIFVLLPTDLKKGKAWLQHGGIAPTTVVPDPGGGSHGRGGDDGDQEEEDGVDRVSNWSSARRRSIGPIRPPVKTGKGSLHFTVGVAQAMSTAERNFEQHEASRVRRRQILTKKRTQCHARIQSRLAARKKTAKRMVLAVTLKPQQPQPEQQQQQQRAQTMTKKRTKKRTTKKKMTKKRTTKKKMTTAVKKQASRTPLPAGWRRAKDPESNKVYYYNKALNQTQWTRPSSSV